MTAKEYLSQAYLLDQRINSHIEEAARLRELAMNLRSPGLGPNYDASQSTEAPFIHPLEKVLELEEHINAEVDELVELKAQIHRVIEMVEDANERLILRYRYLDNMTWAKIGTAMNADTSSVRRWHNNALNHISISNE